MTVSSTLMNLTTLLRMHSEQELSHYFSHLLRSIAIVLVLLYWCYYTGAAITVLLYQCCCTDAIVPVLLYQCCCTGAIVLMLLYLCYCIGAIVPVLLNHCTGAIFATAVS